jgi:ketosteroid isomerase-like protein
MSTSVQDKIGIAREYLLRADQGRSDVLDLFQEDAEIYFPKFGFGSGRESLMEIVRGFAGVMEYIQHDYDRLNFIPAGDLLAVEGTSHGKMGGKPWVAGTTPGGRFCNVFRFRDGRIASVHIYLDPDDTGEDEARFRWGKDRRGNARAGFPFSCWTFHGGLTDGGPGSLPYSTS